MTLLAVGLHRSVLPAALLLVVACGGSAERAAPPVAAPSERSTAFPTAAFAEVSERPVSQATAATFLAALKDMAGPSGMTATVMSRGGTWTGAVGKADGVRDVRVDDQFAIGSVTKSVIAAQVMQLAEAGKLALDDPAVNHLPPDLDFNLNGATVRHLLGMRSGIPDYWPEVRSSLSTDRLRVWTTDDVLDLVPAERSPAGLAFEYTNTNYVLLELLIEQVLGRPVVEVLRAGVLSSDHLDRLIYQPDEVPTEPMSMPDGESTAALTKGGGYLPSLASATAGPTTGAMASDSRSLARWWWSLCAGELVSPASLTEITAFDDGYGLGMYSPTSGVVGHTGEDVGYVAWAGCLPAEGTVIVVLNNRVVEDIGAMAGPLIAAARSAS